MTKPIEVKFVVKESANGKPFLSAEPLNESLSLPVFLELKGEATMEVASQVARFLNEHINAISLG